MMKRIAIIVALVIGLPSSAAANGWVSGIDIWARPQGQGVQISGLGNYVILSRDKNGDLVLTNQISTRKIKTTTAQKKKKPRINIGIGN